MKRIRLYRHHDCERCAKISRVHHRFDWFNRLEDTTEPSPSGPLRPGEIAVQDLGNGVTLTGIECIRLLCRNIPAYWPLLPITYIPFVRRRIENEIGGCSDGACTIPKQPTSHRE